MSVSVWYSVFLVGFLFYIKYLWSRRRLYALSWSLPGPIALPVIGNGLHFLCKNEDILDVLKKIFNSYNTPLSLWLGPNFIVAFNKVNQVEKLITSSKFAQKEKSYRFLIPCLGDGLITASGPKWKAARRWITPLFTTKTVNSYFPICIEHTNILIDILKERVNQPTFDIETYINRCLVDIIADSFMGFKLHAQNGEADEFLETLNRLYILAYSKTISPWLKSDFICKLLGYTKIEEEGRIIIQNYFIKCLESAKARHKEKKKISNKDSLHQESFKSIIDIMLESIPDNSNITNDMEFINHLHTLFSVSEDSLTRVCCFALVMFGMYPEIQNRIVAELHKVFGLESRTLQLEDFSNLRYLKMCIKDIIRLFPVAPVIAREASEDFKIDNHVIPQGCPIMISLLDVHYDPKHWEKPEEFYPENFLSEAVNNRHPFAYLPFSAGPRSCIGKSFSDMALPVILAKILQKYRIEADGILKDKQLTAAVCVRFKDGYPIRLQERN